MSLGYMGYCKIFRKKNSPFATNPVPPSEPVLLLTTGGGVNMVLEPLYSQAIYGTGWYNAPESAHYADAAIRYEGNVSVDWQANADLWDTLRRWGVDERAYARSVDISPNGNAVYNYWATEDGIYDNRGAFCTSLSMSTGAGKLVTGDIGVVALDRAINDEERVPYINQKFGVTSCAELQTTHPLNESGRNTDPIPFWKTDAMIYSLSDGTGSGSNSDSSEIGDNYQAFRSGTPVQHGIKVLEWSVERNNNHQIVYTCGGSREAQYVLMGAITASGSVTMFHPEGVFDPVYGVKGTTGGDNPHNMYNPFCYAEKNVFRVAIQGKTSGDADTVYFVELPAIVIEGDDFGFKGQNDVVSRQFNMKGLGGRCFLGQLLPPHIMSHPDTIFSGTKQNPGTVDEWTKYTMNSIAADDDLMNGRNKRGGESSTSRSASRSASASASASQSVSASASQSASASASQSGSQSASSSSSSL